MWFSLQLFRGILRKSPFRKFKNVLKLSEIYLKITHDERFRLPMPQIFPSRKMGSYLHQKCSPWDSQLLIGNSTKNRHVFRKRGSQRCFTSSKKHAADSAWRITWRRASSSVPIPEKKSWHAKWPIALWTTWWNSSGAKMERWDSGLKKMGISVKRNSWSTGKYAEEGKPSKMKRHYISLIQEGSCFLVHPGIAAWFGLVILRKIITFLLGDIASFT